MDYYQILGVSKDADQKEIKKAFKQLAKKYHPDISKEPNAEEKFKEAQEAYAVLSDADKRAQYDRVGHDAFVNGFGAGGFGSGGFQDIDLSDIFSEIFGNAGFGGFSDFGGNTNQRNQANGPKRGSDVETSLTLTFKEAVFGCTKEITINREQDCKSCNGKGAINPEDVIECSTCHGSGYVFANQQTIFGMMQSQTTCPNCHGKGKIVKNPCKECYGSGRSTYPDKVKVNIPAGVDNGTVVRVPSKGVGGHLGGPDGDLFIVIEVEEDKYFKRNGKDILITIPITYTQATLGTSIACPTIHGDVKLKIPKGTQPNTKLRIKGKGIQTNKGVGDQIVNVKLVVPTNLTKEEKKVLEELREVEGDHGDQKSFFDKIKGLFN